MGIADVVRALGYTTPETESLASKTYADAGQTSLVFATGFVKGRFQQHRADKTIKLTDEELKNLLTRAVLASNLSAHVAALAEANVSIETIRTIIEEVFKFVEGKKAEARKFN